MKFSIRPFAHLAGLVLALLLLAAACGSTGETVVGSGRVTVGRDDAGRTVTLRVGQRLRVDLARSTHRKGGWILVAYPRRILDLRTKTPAGGRFDFVAVAPGGGTITASFVPGCPPPLPAAAGIRCPMGGGNEDRKPSLGTDAVPFKLAVRVEKPAS